MDLSAIAPIADALHQIGTIVFLGGPFFLLFVLRSAARSLESTDERLLIYFAFYRRLFLWVWFALLLIWASGIAQLVVLGLDPVPMHVRVMAGAGAALILVTLVAHFGFHYQMEEAIDAGHWPRAARRASRVRKAMALNFLIGCVGALAGIAAPLIPAG
jgi:uncharacterized membrane protein